MKPGASCSAEELQRFVKERLAPFKYLRWIEFVETLPKTATGKIQAFQAARNGFARRSRFDGSLRAMIEMIPIPGDYLYGKVGPRWRVLLYGLNKGWIGAQAAVQFARRIDDENFSIDVMDVLEAQSSPDILEKVRMLAEKEPQVPDDILLKQWMCVVLSFAYDHRDELSDPLGVVEQLADDFGFPQELRGIVRFVPPDDGWNPREHSLEEGTSRLISKWRDYVEKCSRELRAR